MTIQGNQVELVDRNSSEFKNYNKQFGNTLVNLYKISYTEIFPRNLSSGNWGSQYYYHGTGHCGCLARRARSTNPSKIRCNEWCGSEACATQGILNHGHLMTWSRGGHFFSPNFATALGYSLSKSGPQAHLPIFICKARNFVSGGDICSVQSDADILPHLMAIVLHQ